MKNAIMIISVLVILFLISGCISTNKNQLELKAKIDSLQSKLNNSYIPGTGEIMSNIVQPHHLKLWRAGQTQNWPLAAYETHLIEGGFKRIQKFHKGSPEAIATPMIYPPLEAIKLAIREQNAKEFKSGFAVLTHTCNTCHTTTNYNFNLIVVPTLNAPTNQKF